MMMMLCFCALLIVVVFGQVKNGRKRIPNEGCRRQKQHASNQKEMGMEREDEICSEILNYPRTKRDPTS